MTELLISLSILIGGYFLVRYWAKKAVKEKKQTILRSLDEFEEKIS